MSQHYLDIQDDVHHPGVNLCFYRGTSCVFPPWQFQLTPESMKYTHHSHEKMKGDLSRSITSFGGQVSYNSDHSYKILQNLKVNNMLWVTLQEDKHNSHKRKQQKHASIQLLHNFIALINAISKMTYCKNADGSRWQSRNVEVRPLMNVAFLHATSFIYDQKLPPALL